MRIGVVVNPVAGLGGPAAFRGSDDVEQQRQAIAMGVEPRAGARMRRALAACAQMFNHLTIATWGGAMGEHAVDGLPVRSRVLGSAHEPSTANDTRVAIERIVADGIDLLMIAGGDGTLRDALLAIPPSLPVLGVPAGVKMRSGVFAVTPEDAGAIVVRLVEGGLVAADRAEVQDVDDVVPRTYGELHVPRIGGYLQHLKVGGRENEALVLAEIAAWIDERLAHTGSLVLLGPGSTTFEVKRKLRIDGTLMGVDAVRGGAAIALDADAPTLERIVDADTVIVISFTRGQGFLLGRGNQQLSAPLLQRIRRRNLWVIGTRTKLATLEGRPFRVDTGDATLDRALAGLVEVVTGYDDVCYHRIG